MPCWTGSWLKTRTPECPSSRSSTSASPNGVATGSATRTCPMIRRHGASPSPHWTRRRARRLRTTLRATGAQRAARHHRRGAAVRGTMAWTAGRPPLLIVDALRLQRLLRPSVGLERDRLRRSGLSAWLQVPGSRVPASPGRSRSADAEDPVPWVERAEAAKKRHAERDVVTRCVAPSIGRGRRAATDERCPDDAMSRRGCLPNDGSRTNHQLRRDMRRYGQ